MYPLKPNQGSINLPFNPPRPSLIFVRKAREPIQVRPAVSLKVYIALHGPIL